MTRFSHIISAIDAHTGGEPTRIVLSGLPPISGTTLPEKKAFMRDRLDHFRTLLMQEPRGHSDMFGVILTSAIGDKAQFGLLFMDGAGYIDMCGHGVMSVTTALIQTGAISPTEPQTRVVFETPAGLVEACAEIEKGEVREVSVANVASFLYAKDVELELAEFGRLTIDVAFGGNFFAILKADKNFGISIRPDYIHQLIRLGLLVRAAANDKVKVHHPVNRHITAVALTEIYEKPDPLTPFSKSAVVFGNGQLDRCPCGTGTSALMATLHGKDELALGTEYTSEGIIGTRFIGKLTGESRVGGFRAVHPVVTGQAFIMGLQQFVVAENDPVKYGFCLKG